MTKDIPQHWIKEALMPPQIKTTDHGNVTVRVFKKNKNNMRYFLTGERTAVLNWLNEKKWQYRQECIAVKRIKHLMDSLNDPQKLKDFKPKSGDDETADLVSVTLDIDSNER